MLRTDTQVENWSVNFDIELEGYIQFQPGRDGRRASTFQAKKAVWAEKKQTNKKTTSSVWKKIDSSVWLQCRPYMRFNGKWDKNIATMLNCALWKLCGCDGNRKTWKVLRTLVMVRGGLWKSTSDYYCMYDGWTGERLGAGSSKGKIFVLLRGYKV